MLFDSYAVGDEQVLEELLSLYRATGVAVNPQTATGALASRLYRRSLVTPMVTLAQLAPEKSAVLLAELGVWDKVVSLPPPSFVEHPLLNRGDISGLLQYIRGI
jgi:threonine synthase